MRTRFVTKDSRMRRNMYQADIRRNQLESEFHGSKEEFLRSLSMCMTIRVASELDLRRAEELTIRTHQLNTTGRSYSYDELKELINSPDHLLLVAELEDRYGTSGTVGLALIEKGSDVWLVKLLITSCRVITRGVGGIMISYILQSAKRRGVRLRATFVANDRNRMMYIAYKFSGFYEVAGQNSSILLGHDLESIRSFPDYVMVQLPSDQ
jgi:FkbH-like protein